MQQELITMQTSPIVGIWKLESSAGKPPAESNIKTGLIKFKVDGTFVDATEVQSPCPVLSACAPG
jgi:hypothetical protein